jgi:hypothetical protein
MKRQKRVPEMQSRADLHVHSRHSDRPSEWFLRRIGAPESFVEPLAIYDTCMARGMDFVTITDHNSIDGALEIAHLPNTFLSAEVTTYFPADGCKLHVLVYGISEDQFSAIQQVRESVYDLRQFLIEEDIVHAVAHPFFQVNARMSTAHMEELLLLFKRFELINAMEHNRSVVLLKRLLTGLTPADIDEMADRHGLAPIEPEPWVKYVTGGSDDHSGVYTTAAVTVTPKAASVDEYIGFLRAGRHEADGTAGSSLRFAHSLYHIAHGYYRSKLMGGAQAAPRMLGTIFRKLLPEGRKRRVPLRDKVRDVVTGVGLSLRKKRLSATERMLVEEFQRLFQNETPAAGAPAAGVPRDDGARTFRTACDITQQFSYVIAQKCVDHAREARLFDFLQTLSTLGPVALGIAPYLAAVRTMSKDKGLLRAVTARFDLADPDAGGRRAWLFDAPPASDGGEADTGLIAEALRAGPGMTCFVTCDTLEHRPVTTAMNFRPVGRIVLSDDLPTAVTVPPFLEIVDFVERREFDEVVVSAPGPLGLTGLLAARLLGLKLTAVFCTDFSESLRHLFDDEALENLAQQFIAWFAGQADTVFVADPDHREALIAGGVEPAACRVMPSIREMLPSMPESATAEALTGASA